MGNKQDSKKIVIVGGGFGGVLSALSLARKKIPGIKIILISNKPHFEYTPAFYKLATGASPLETCIPLNDIFSKLNVEIVNDEIVEGSASEKFLIGKNNSRYNYDILVMALGSEPAYFNIPGIADAAFTLKCVTSALRLKRHIHELYSSKDGALHSALMMQFQFVIVGGGPAGVELAGVIKHYTKNLAKRHGIPENLITVDLVQGGQRLLSTMNEKVSDIALKRLDNLGINIILGKAVVSGSGDKVLLNGIELNAKTIIWTAGVKANHVYKKIDGLNLDKNGRVLVDENLCAQNQRNIFIVGDGASTTFSGTAQTAIRDGQYIAKVIESTLKDQALPKYQPVETPYVVPIGHKWAIFTYKKYAFTGRIFWWMRELIDLRFFLLILPIQKAFRVWSEGNKICESCPICSDQEK